MALGCFRGCIFHDFLTFQGGIGRPFWHSSGAWGRTWALGKDLWAVSALYCDLWGGFLASLGTLVADIGCLWASFGRSLVDFWSFEVHFGHFVEAFWILLATFCAFLDELLEKS